jgi:8-oxo-dGTP pyrophosphatase MutT (NUDIX family)
MARASRTVFAAGGLIRRTQSDQTQIVVIHRPRGDWTLPKGKRDEGETLEETALREVKEETGFDARLGAFASTVAYPISDRHKLVFYWHMTVASGEFKPTKEVDELVWLTPEQAIERLTYTYERELVAREYLVATRTSGTIAEPARVFSTAAKVRLAAALEAYGPELEHRIERSREQPLPDRLWIDTARELVRRAEESLSRSAIDEGWRCLFAAQRMECFGLMEGELRARASVLRVEAEKLGRARRRAMAKLLARDDLGPMDLFQAMALRDDAVAEQRYEIRVRREQIVLLLGVLTAAMVLFLGTVTLAHVALGAAALEADAGSLLAAALLGACGASIGAILRLGRRTRAIDPSANAWSTLLRPAVGAVAAILVYFVLAAGIVSLGTPSAARIFVLCFAAGFTERWVLRRRS